MTIFTEQVKKLVNATNGDEEQAALSQLLTIARKTNINYGYRVFNITKNKRTLPAEIDKELDDVLAVTILVGESLPYEEYEWKPKDNWRITSLIVP